MPTCTRSQIHFSNEVKRIKLQVTTRFKMNIILMFRNVKTIVIKEIMGSLLTTKLNTVKPQTNTNCFESQGDEDQQEIFVSV